MENNLIEDRKTIRHLSEYMDSLINKAVSTGMHDPAIEKELKELKDVLKSLDKSADSIENGLEEK